MSGWVDQYKMYSSSTFQCCFVSYLLLFFSFCVKHMKWGNIKTAHRDTVLYKPWRAIHYTSIFLYCIIGSLYILLLHHISVMRWNSLVCAACRSVFSPVSVHTSSSVTAVSHSSKSLDILSSLISCRHWLLLLLALAAVLWNFFVDLASI